MRLRHSDNTVFLTEGTVEFPTHGEEIEKHIRVAINQAVSLYDPQIFGCGAIEDTHGWGGVAQTYERAVKKGLTIINLGEKA